MGKAGKLKDNHSSRFLLQLPQTDQGPRQIFTGSHLWISERIKLNFKVLAMEN